LRKSPEYRCRRPLFQSLLGFCTLAWFLAGPLALAADVPPAKNVLVLYSFSQREVFDPLLLEATVRSHVPAPVNFYVEYLESQRFGSVNYEKSVSETLRQTYAKQKFDLVIVAVYPALEFAVKYRDRIFPGVPIVFMMVAPGRVQDRRLWPRVTGVTIQTDIPGTLDLALRLHPDTRNVAVVSGNSEFERYWQALTHQELRQRTEKLSVTDLVGLPPDQLLRQVSALPPHTVIFFQLVPQESLQLAVGTYDVLAAISQRFPTYCIHNYCFDHGVIGGSYPDMDEQVVKAGGLAGQVLSGESPDRLAVINGSRVYRQVDWRQLRRWNIPESRLPANTVVLYRQPTVWERYEKFIFAGMALIVLQTLLIIGLLWQRRRKQEAEAGLRESDQRFRVMADTTPALVWMCDQQGNVTYLNDRRIDFTGRDRRAGFADAWTTFIHPDDVQNVRTVNCLALEKHEAFSKEYRLRRRDGLYRWILDVAAPRFNGDGSFAGFIGSAIDITDQKLAREALEKIGGKLIEAQEKERAFIARELHDDICQRLAMLSMELGQVNREPENGGTAENSEMETVQQHCAEIARDVQALSHELHSSKLDYLGIVAALKSFCRDTSQQQNVNVEFTDQDVPNAVPRNVSLCLFRVTQEAVHNAVKYSGVRRLFVDLRGRENQIRLEVRDAGIGFDFKEESRNGGLGLVSMQERVHLVKGTFSVESKPNGGTRIVALVPLPAEANAAAAAVVNV